MAGFNQYTKTSNNYNVAARCKNKIRVYENKEIGKHYYLNNEKIKLNKLAFTNFYYDEFNNLFQDFGEYHHGRNYNVIDFYERATVEQMKEWAFEKLNILNAKNNIDWLFENGFISKKEFKDFEKATLARIKELKNLEQENKKRNIWFKKILRKCGVKFVQSLKTFIDSMIETSNLKIWFFDNVKDEYYNAKQYKVVNYSFNGKDKSILICFENVEKGYQFNRQLYLK